MSLSWTQPLCDKDYLKRYGEIIPTRLLEAVRETETCCDCGEETQSGIYSRIDPTTVEFPRSKP